MTETVGGTMNRPTIGALTAAVLLAATACTAPTEQAAPEASTAPPASAEPSVSVEDAKAAAIASGRPEAAWDIDCVAWELPDADSPEQEWANTLTVEWLDRSTAECPDAITWPMYFIESASPGADGELVVNVDSTINNQMFGPDDDSALRPIVYYVFNALADDHPELSAVTATTINGQRSVTLDRSRLADARDMGGALPEHVR